VRSGNRLFAIGFAVLATGGCHSGSQPSPSPTVTATSAAAAACAATVASGEHLVAAYDTTLAEVRARQAGYGVRPAASFAPTRAETDAAAWCWIDTADGATRRVVAATASGEQTTFVNGSPSGLTPSEDGPPSLP
jgi:hypothetical protein